MYRSISKVLKSESLKYIFLRYVTYIIQFINSLILAKFLGVYVFGLYSFILLFQQYASFANLGVNESLNIEYAKYYSKSLTFSNLIWGASWIINTIFTILFVLFGYIFFSLFPDIGGLYKVADYSFYLLIYCALFNQNKIYITYYKLHGKLSKLNVQQLMPNMLLLIITLYYQYDLTIDDILITLIIGNSISLIVFKINLPGRLSWAFNRIIYFRIINRGISLLLYNMSFCFMTIAASSLISIYYSVKLFGEYSLANSMSNAITMAGGSFLFIFYPKMISKFSDRNFNEHRIFIERIRSIYILAIDCVTMSAIIFVPIVSYFLPEYKELTSIFSLLMLGKIFNNATSGYATYLISKSKEKKMVIAGFLSIIVLIILGIFVSLVEGSLLCMISLVPLVSLFYSLFVIYMGRSVLGCDSNVLSVLNDVFGSKRYLFVIAILIYVWGYESILVLWIGLGLFMLCNLRNIKKLTFEAYQIVTDNKKLSL